MRVFLEVKQEKITRYINIDEIEEMLAYTDGAYMLWTKSGSNINVSEDEFLKWKKSVEVIR